MSRKVKLDISLVATLFPEVWSIEYLPRKKKKALKKKISNLIVKLIKEKIDHENIFN